MRKISILLFTLFITFNICSVDLSSSLNRFINKKVVVYYSVAGSSSAEYERGTLEEITELGIIIKTKHYKVLFINFDFIASIGEEK